jgi:hypothetical protein
MESGTQYLLGFFSLLRSRDISQSRPPRILKTRNLHSFFSDGGLPPCVYSATVQNTKHKIALASVVVPNLPDWIVCNKRYSRRTISHKFAYQQVGDAEGKWQELDDELTTGST